MKADKTKSRELEKTPPLKKWIWFSELNDKTKLANQRRFCICSSTCPPTVCVTCVWAGWDSAWEQEKLEARKMPENAAESHTSGARGVGGLCARRAD